MQKSRAKIKRIATPARTCTRCGSASLKQKLATYPVPLTGKLIGRRIDVYRVEHDHCRDCGLLAPTPEGYAKIKRCTQTGIDLFLNNLP